jgi:hypothetical protein
MDRFFLFFLFINLNLLGCRSTNINSNAEVKDNNHDTLVNKDWLKEKGWSKKKIDIDQLLSAWALLGDGNTFKFAEQLYLDESEHSKGVVLLSPDYYRGDIVLRYKVLALSPGSVFVSIISAKDKNSSQLSIPEKYKGEMNFWSEEAENYFFAFKNASHNSTPFIKKNPNDNLFVTATDQDKMTVGVYYNIEVGRVGSELWLSIDDKIFTFMVDKNPIREGHIAFRLRGTAGLPAKCLIKDFEVYINDN